MWGSRLALCAIVVALAVPAAPASGSSTQPEADTLQVSSSVRASAETPLTLTVTAPASQTSESLRLTLSLPSGWTDIPSSPSDVACPNSVCELLSATSTQIVIDARLPAAHTITLNVQATPPGSAGSYNFTALEQFYSNPPVALEVTAPVTVTCPQDGLGTMTVNPMTVPAATGRTLTFTYTAGGCSLGAGGVVGVTVPGGWTLPTMQSGTPGFATWTDSPQITVSGSMIIVPTGNLAPGTAISFEYESAQASSSGSATFLAWQSGAGGPLQPLASSPVVMVTPIQATATPTQPTTAPTQATNTPVPPAAPSLAGGAGTMTVTPTRVTASRPTMLRFTYTSAQAGLPSSGEVTVRVPAGWTAPSRTPGQDGYASASAGLVRVSGRLITVTGVTLRPGQQLTVSYAATPPGTAGVATFLTSQRPDGTATLAALRVSPSVNIALPGGLPGWLPILAVVAGLVLAAGTGGLLASRRLRRGGHGPAGGSVRAVPRTGPPPSVAVHYTGNRPALTVRIEPRAGATVTTIEEIRP